MGRPPQGPVAVASSTSHIQEQPPFRRPMPGNYPEYEYSTPSTVPTTTNDNITTSISPDAMIENLSLAGLSTCSCHSRADCSCGSSSSSRRKSSSPSNFTSSSNSTYFWKRTLRNPITKRPYKPRGSILTPPKLKLLLNSQQPVVNEVADSAGSTSSTSLRLLYPGQQQDSSDVCIPDLSLLSLGNNMTTSNLDLRLQQSLQIATPGMTPSYPRRFRNLKWKTRILCSLATTSSSGPSLPTIREDRDGEEEEGNVTEISQTEMRNVQNPSQGGRGPGDNQSGPVVDDVTIDELASYLENGVYIPKKMSVMAEMMYT